MEQQADVTSSAEKYGQLHGLYEREAIDNAAMMGSRRNVPLDTVWDCPGIQVCVRVRPLTQVERVDPDVKNAVECLEDHVVLDLSVGKSATRYFGSRNARPKPMRFPFHHVFHQRSTQSEVFMSSCAAIVQGAFAGINGAVMAYGATGSGKTHSMFGGDMSAPGVIFQSAQLLFSERERLLTLNPDGCIRVVCSFIEVYNEEVFDLLSNDSRCKPLQVQDLGAEAEKGASNHNNAESFALRGLVTVAPRDVEEFVGIVQRGLKNRAVASTNANAQSSRSHAIVTIEVEVKEREDSSRGTMGRLRFCDLAGCERAAQLVSSNERLREGAKINHSLLELGRVTQALALRSMLQAQRDAAAAAAAEAKPGVRPNKPLPPTALPFISWRGSKLTRLMRDCLNGNCRTTLLVCISPTSHALENSRNAMFFAMKAKEVQLTARANEYRVDTPALAKEQAKTIERLRGAITLLKETLRSRTGTCHIDGIDHETAAEFDLHSTEAAVAAAGGPMRNSMTLGLVPIERLLQLPGAAENSAVGATPLEASHEVASTPLKVLSLSTGAQRCSPQSNNRLQTSGSPTDPPPSTRASTVYKRLDDDLMKVSREKSMLHQLHKDAEQRGNDLDVKIRDIFLQLAEFIARSDGKASALQGDVNNPPPLSIVHAQTNLRTLAKERQQAVRKAADLEEKLKAMDVEVGRIRRHLQVEGSDFFSEVILDRANLHEAVTTAETFSALYLQGQWLMQKRLAEYQSTQERLTASVRHLLAYCPADAADERREAAVALSFADMCRSNTNDMLDNFRSRLAEFNYVFENSASASSNHHALPLSAAASSSNVVGAKRASGGSSFVIPAGDGHTVPAHHHHHQHQHQQFPHYLSKQNASKRKMGVAMNVNLTSPVCSDDPMSSTSTTPSNNSFSGVGKSCTGSGGMSAAGLPCATHGGKSGVRNAILTGATMSREGGVAAHTSTPTSAGGGGTAAFARTMSHFTPLTASPAMLRKVTSGTPWLTKDASSQNVAPPSAPAKKPPVPFTSGDAAAKAAIAAAAAASASGLSFKTLSSGNILGQGARAAAAANSAGGNSAAGEPRLRHSAEQ